MRVIAGHAKGTKLWAPKGLRIRPSADRVKESLFSILSDRIPGANVLDLFAGTGALGVEAASRGARYVVFVDSSASAATAIRRNLESTKLTQISRLIEAPATGALAMLGAEGQQFDLIFLDPPYRIRATKLASILDDLPIVLREGGVVVLEHRPDLLEFPVANLVQVDQRQYGDTSLSFFKKR